MDWEFTLMEAGFSLEEVGSLELENQENFRAISGDNPYIGPGLVLSIKRFGQRWREQALQVFSSASAVFSATGVSFTVSLSCAGVRVGGAESLSADIAVEAGVLPS